MLIEKSFNTGELTLNYAEGPTNGPTLLLIHGVTSRWQTFTSIIPQLSQQWHLFACDLRGHGKSDHQSGHYAIIDFVRDVVSFSKAKLDGPLVIIGHSLGGLVALGTAAQLATGAKALIMMDAPFIERDTPRFLKSPQPKYFSRLHKRVTSVDTFEAMCQVMQGDAPELSPARRDRAEELFQVDPDVLMSILDRRLPVDFDFTRILAQVTCPALLMQADPEIQQVMRDEDVAFAIGHLQQSQSVLIKDAGHAIHQDQTEVCLAVIEEFWGKLQK